MEDKEIYNNLLDLRDILNKINANLYNCFDNVIAFMHATEKASEMLGQDFYKKAYSLYIAFNENFKIIRDGKGDIEDSLNKLIEEYYDKVYPNGTVIEDWPEVKGIEG